MYLVEMLAKFFCHIMHNEIKAKNKNLLVLQKVKTTKLKPISAQNDNLLPFFCRGFCIYIWFTLHAGDGCKKLFNKL